MSATKNEHIAIIGAGAIGLLATMGTLVYNTIPIAIDERLNKAKEIGVKYVINSATQNVEEEIQRFSVIIRNEFQIRGLRNGSNEFEESIELIYSRKAPVEKIITEVVSFDKIT